MDLLTELASLLNQNSVRVGKFRLASGRESDFFIDCKTTLLTAKGHRAAGSVMLKFIREEFKDAQAVAGVELGGCPLASATSLLDAGLGNMDALYVRKARKDHGTGKLVEGHAPPGSKVVLLEDVVTTGGSSLRAIESLRAEGYEVLGVIAVVDRQEGASEAFRDAGVRFIAALTREDLMVMRETKKPRAVCFFRQREDGKILAVSRKDNHALFGLPGGKVDPGESPEQALTREVWEELRTYISGVRPVFTDNDSSYVTTTYTSTGMYPLPDTSRFRTDGEGIVEWVAPIDLLNGPFGEYNAKLFAHIGVKI